MADFHAEATPTQFVGERVEANAIEWFRLEQFGKGLSSRLFFNEQPQINWLRHNGHIDDMNEELAMYREQVKVFKRDLAKIDSEMDQVKKRWFKVRRSQETMQI